MQINSSNVNVNRNMNSKYLVVVAAMAIMLIGATALATTESAFAGGKKHYEKNHATSQTNACGNGLNPIDVFCQNASSQIQGDENIVTLLPTQSGTESEPPA